MDVDSWVASRPSITPNGGALRASPGRPRPFLPGTLSSRAQRLPRSPLIPYQGFGESRSKPPAVPPADVEAAAQAKESQGFTYLAAGAGAGVAAAALSALPMAARVGLALGGTLATILGVKNLAEGEATRQAGLKVGVVLAECMASKIVGGSKIPV